MFGVRAVNVIGAFFELDGLAYRYRTKIGRFVERSSVKEDLPRVAIGLDSAPARSKCFDEFGNQSVRYITVSSVLAQGVPEENRGAA